MARQKPQGISQILMAALPRDRISPLDRVRLKWKEAVGVELARRSEPIGLESGLLTVGVNEVSWGKEVVKLQRRIISNLETSAGAALVTRIRFVREGRPVNAEPHPTRDLRIAQVTSPAVREAAAPIADPELRDIVIRTAERYLSAQAVRRALSPEASGAALSPSATGVGPRRNR